MFWEGAEFSLVNVQRSGPGFVLCNEFAEWRSDPWEIIGKISGIGSDQPFHEFHLRGDQTSLLVSLDPWLQEWSNKSNKLVHSTVLDVYETSFNFPDLWMKSWGHRAMYQRTTGKMPVARVHWICCVIAAVFHLSRLFAKAGIHILTPNQCL